MRFSKKSVITLFLAVIFTIPAITIAQENSELQTAPAPQKVNYLPSPFSVLSGDGTSDKGDGIKATLGDLAGFEADLPQIVIETRFLTVEPSRLAELFQLLDSSRFELSKTDPTLLASLLGDDPGKANGAQSENTISAMAISASLQSNPVTLGVISDAESKSVMNFLKSDIRSYISQSPTVTLFDGQDAVVTDGSQRPFVVNLEVVENGVGERAIQPVVQAFLDGTILKHQGTINGDTIQLNSTLLFNEIESVETMEVSAGPAAGMSVQTPRCKMQICKTNRELKSGEYLMVDTGYNRTIRRRPEPTAVQRLPVVGRLVSLELEEVPYRMLVLIRATKVDP